MRAFAEAWLEKTNVQQLAGQFVDILWGVWLLTLACTRALVRFELLDSWASGRDRALHNLQSLGQAFGILSPFSPVIRSAPRGGPLRNDS